MWHFAKASFYYLIRTERKREREREDQLVSILTSDSFEGFASLFRYMCSILPFLSRNDFYFFLFLFWCSRPTAIVTFNLAELRANEPREKHKFEITTNWFGILQFLNDIFFETWGPFLKLYFKINTHFL